jgi:cytochrome c553
MTTLVRAIAALGLVFVAWLLGGSRSREEVVRAPIVRLVVKHPWLTAGAMAIVAIAVAVLLVISGVVPIKASSGHWRVTAAFLDFAKTRSVATHSWGIDAPPLDDEALVLRGASHYETACVPCHGGPEGGVPPVVAAMTPPPPELTRQLSRWTPQELFSIVKHGIKFTGMPAWPIQERDDEVWAMVAFLRRMPRLDAAAYRTLAFGEQRPALDGLVSPPTVAHEQAAVVIRDICTRCHGVDGTGRGPGAFPSLAGQRAEYLYRSLRAFADRQRFSGIMSAIAAQLSEDTMQAVSEYYARLRSRQFAAVTDAAAMSRGDLLANRGLPDRDIPSCADCHAPSDTPRNPAYPLLAGQHQRYLALQLELFKGRRRGGSPYADLMHVFVDRLDQQQIGDVSLYFSTLKAASPNSPAGPPQR